MGTARTRASLKYNQKNYDYLRITVKKGELENLKEIARSQGKSLNRFVTDAIYDKVKCIWQVSKMRKYVIGGIRWAKKQVQKNIFG